jgi:hypothetical protein
MNFVSPIREESKIEKPSLVDGVAAPAYTVQWAAK